MSLNNPFVCKPFFQVKMVSHEESGYDFTAQWFRSLSSRRQQPSLWSRSAPCTFPLRHTEAEKDIHSMAETKSINFYCFFKGILKQDRLLPSSFQSAMVGDAVTAGVCWCNCPALCRGPAVPPTIALVPSVRLPTRWKGQSHSILTQMVLTSRIPWGGLRAPRAADLTWRTAALLACKGP